MLFIIKSLRKHFLCDTKNHTIHTIIKCQSDDDPDRRGKFIWNYSGDDTFLLVILYHLIWDTFIVYSDHISFMSKIGLTNFRK